MKCIFVIGCLVLAALQSICADTNVKDLVKIIAETSQKHADRVLKANRYISKSVETYAWLRKTLPFLSHKSKKSAESEKLSLELADLPRDLKILRNRLSNQTSAASEKLNDYYDGIKKIQHYYEIYQNIVKFGENASEMTAKEFAETVLSLGRQGVDEILNSTQRALIDAFSRGKNTLLHLNERELVRELMCMKKQSSQRLLYNLYESILMTESKGFIMTSFANQYLSEKGNISVSTLETENTQAGFENRVHSFFEEVKKSLADKSRELWRCDPSEHVEGKTYERIGPIFQKYVMHEPDAHEKSTLSIFNFAGCAENCEYYKNPTAAHCHTEYCRSLQAEKVCTGNVQECAYVENNLHICPSKDADRRYEYIRTKTGQLFGRNVSCEGTETMVSGNYHQVFVHCSFCICTCEDERPSYSTYISLKPIVADVSDNMVVTGARVKKTKNTIHIEIQQGKLMSNGKIDFDSVRWQQLADSEEAPKINDQDYLRISWNRKAVALDDIEATDNRVLTGLRFKYEEGYVKLEIHTTPFDLESGKLSVDGSQWRSDNSSTKTERSELTLNEAGVPTSYENHMPDSRPGQYLRFSTSDLRTDAGQSVVPFVDAQPVTSAIAAPLVGAGLFHRGAAASAGFLALKLLTLDLKPLFDAV